MNTQRNFGGEQILPPFLFFKAESLQSWGVSQKLGYLQGSVSGTRRSPFVRAERCSIERFPWRFIGWPFLECGEHFITANRNVSRGHLFLGSEIAKQGPSRHTYSFGDFIHCRGLEALSQEHVHCRLADIGFYSQTCTFSKTNFIHSAIIAKPSKLWHQVPNLVYDASMNKIDYTQETTLITGASSGLGAEFARQLAARGSNLVLVARRADRLHDLEAGLTGKYGISVKTVPFDLATADAGRRLHQELAHQGVKVTSLINCAGFGTHGEFSQEDAEQIQQEIALNVAALVDMTHTFVQELSGVLVNVASLLGYQSWPTAAVYGATKAFVLSFTEALWEEKRNSGLRILALAPGPTRTEFFEVAGSKQMSAGAPMQTARQVVDTALRVLDRRTPPPSVVPGPINKLIATLPRFMPRRLAVQAFGKIVRRGV